MNQDLKMKWKSCRTRLVISIGQQLRMEKEDQILMMMSLNTPENISKFSEWTKTKTVNGKLKSTPEEVMHTVTLIAKEKPLD